MDKTPGSLYPLPIWRFVKVLEEERAETWGERHIEWITQRLQARGDEVLYHRSPSTSSLEDFVRRKKISLAGKTAHCDVQNTVWRLNLDARNDRSPIDSLWTDPDVRFFRHGSETSVERIDLTSFERAKRYAEDLSKRPYRKTGRGVICPAKDGCFCRSLEEVQIDDWLAARGFPHEKEPSYPRHPTLNTLGRKRADWLVGHVWIEYAGLNGERYDANLRVKISLAQEFSLQQVVLARKDLAHLDAVLLPQLRKASAKSWG